MDIVWFTRMLKTKKGPLSRMRMLITIKTSFQIKTRMQLGFRPKTILTNPKVSLTKLQSIPITKTLIKLKKNSSSKKERQT